MQNRPNPSFYIQSTKTLLKHIVYIYIKTDIHNYKDADRK